RSVLLYCDEESTSLLRDSLSNFTVIDCVGMENGILREILNEEVISQNGRVNRNGETLCYVIFNGFDNSTIGSTIKEIRLLLQKECVFATTTESNLNWKLEDLLSELTEEHDYFKKARRVELEE
ncbi:MAG: DUF3783 domain-containing protein, partial [Kosmotogaceae bacterium]|nr:DUF3783 domain-containing protein [Kosmotogaceae bacterium]